MLIPSSLGIPVLYCFWWFLLLLAVFSAFSGFSGGLDVPGVLGLQAGGVWASLGMSEQFQVTGS